MTDNILLKDFDTPYQTPPFDKIKPEFFVPAIKEYIEEARSNIDAIKNNAEEPTFENTIEALESCSENLDKVTSAFYTLLSVIGGDEYNTLAGEIGPLTADFGSDIMLDPDLFKRVKAVYDKREERKYEEVEKTLLEDTYDGFVRSGALLEDTAKARLREINAESSTLSPQFSENVIKSSEKFELKITDESELKGVPETAIEGAKHEAEERGYENTWVFTLDFPSFIPFMTYAENRSLREKMWRAFSVRAFGDEFDNTFLIQRILELRHERVKLLGYQTYADFVLEDRMVKKTKDVIGFLDTLFKTYKPAAETDLKKLREFAQKHDGLEELKPWDVGYYSEKLKENLFEFSEEDLRVYFPLDRVLDGTFQHFQKLFNLDFKVNENVPSWHEDVKAYEVRDQETGDLFGILYADMYVRKNKRSGAWKASLRDHGQFHGEPLPAVMEIVCNFSKPTPKRPSLLSHNDVLTLFHEMGHAIHALLGRTKYQSTSGTNVLWDFVELPSQVQENWLYESETLNMVSGHYQTGEKIPADLIEKMRKAKTFMSGWTGLRQLTYCYMDMAYHTQKDAPQAENIQTFEKQATEKCRLFKDYGGCSSTSFGHIFAGGYSAGYYSYKWAEVLDADTFELFLENGLYDRTTALRYRHEILEKGGSEDPAILYRRFRGRDADPKALLRREGLLEDAA